MPLCINTLSMTTWRDSGLTRAKSYSMKLIRKTSPRSLRVFDQAGDEPGEVELGEATRQTGATGNQNEFARPLLAEDLHTFYRGATAFKSRILQQHVLRAHCGRGREA